MPRRGRLLEVMVQRLEEFMVPEGVVVKSPEVFYGEAGKKIGEIDVTLRGNFGHCELLVGIECRDRPSDGPQGRGWINQINGKRDDLKVNQMIAVSTTGFTDPAVELANSSGVDLLTVEDISKLDLHGWFEVLTLRWTEGSEVVAAKAVLNACRSLGEDEIVALTGECRIKQKRGDLIVIVTAKRSAADNSLLDLRLDFFDENYEPRKMPAGTRFTLYGLKDPLDEQQ